MPPTSLDIFARIGRALMERAVIFAAAAVLGGVGLLLTRKRQLRAKTWLFLWGTVEYAEPKMVGGGQTAHWVGALSYSYSIDGEYDSGGYEFPASDEDDGWNLVDGWKGRTVIIHYSPENPEKSVFIPDEQDQASPQTLS